jgi:hypothetical protein
MKAQNDVPKSKLAREEKKKTIEIQKERSKREWKGRKTDAPARAKSGKRTQGRLLRGF